MTDTVNEYKKTESSKNSQELNVGFTYKAITASTKLTNENSREVSNFLSTKVQTSSSSKFEYERKEEREYNVGPNSVLELYQLKFEAPGVEYTFPTLSTVYEPPRVVPINVVVEPIRFLHNIRVQYADDEGGRPTDRIREVNNKNDDIYFQFGGKFVYLVPEYTLVTDNAMTNIDIVITGGNKPGFSDVSKGAGGDNRYIVPVRGTFVTRKITEVALLRNENSAGSLAQVPGYDGITKDINEGRGKHFLHLVFKTVKV